MWKHCDVLFQVKLRNAQLTMKELTADDDGNPHMYVMVERSRGTISFSPIRITYPLLKGIFIFTFLVILSNKIKNSVQLGLLNNETMGRKADTLVKLVYIL